MILEPGDAYRRWAPRYESETAVTILEQELADRLAPPPHGGALLDVGCGTGRRLPSPTVCRAVGLDLVPAMLRAGRARTGPRLGAADVRGLPVADAGFDVVWCRLTIGHVAELDAAYAELARVARPGGVVLVTDVHPAAIAAGHRRSFRDGDGIEYDIEHHTHGPEGQAAAARAAGLTPTAVESAGVGPSVRDRYADAGRLEWYERDRGLPLVLALRYRR